MHSISVPFLDLWHLQKPEGAYHADFYTYRYTHTHTHIYIYIYTYSSVLFHQVTFDHSISWVLLIDKTNESCQNSEKLERNAISTKKKEFKKKRKWYYTSKDKCPNFLNFFRMLKINNSNLSNENKEIKNDAWTTSRGNNKSVFAI